MNIAITLPKFLWEQMCSGEKQYECRKRIPRNFFRDTDCVFVILKGTTDVVGCFFISQFISCVEIKEIKESYLNKLGVVEEWLDDYAAHEDVLHLWEIDQVVYEFSKPQNREEFLGITQNPQSYVYCKPLIDDNLRLFRRGRAFHNFK